MTDGVEERRPRSGLRERSPVFPPPGIDAVVFDLDGVVTETARLHAEAWREVFDDLLSRRAAATGEPFRPFTDEDYGRYVDGRPRHEGAAAFLRSRGIELPPGGPDEGPGDATVAAIGDRKNELYLRMLRERGAEAYESSVRLIRSLKDAGVMTAAITASRNGRAVVEGAGVGGLFDVLIDGADAAAAGLRGKPEPDVFAEAARRLGVPPSRTAIVEDAEAGVLAGRRGGFAFVLGVDRLGRAGRLRAAGADEVVNDLGELQGPPRARGVRLEGPAEGAQAAAPRLISELPSALESRETIAARLRSGEPAVFLDYDGTLAPIAPKPGAAYMPTAVGEAVARLARAVPTAVLSGRDLRDVRERAGIGGVFYAGSHGFEIVAPDGTPVAEEEAAVFERCLPALDAAEQALRASLSGLEGVLLERKRYAVAVHYRQAGEAAAREADRAVERVAGATRGLRRTSGKKVFELRPDVDWDKGRALLRLLKVPGLGGEDAVPLFIGDDETDEDALRVVAGRGVGIVVRGEEDRPTLAGFALDDPHAVGAFLGWLADELQGRPGDR